MIFDERFDVIVIGAGHAGCEAASAAARMGAQTALITLNLDLIGQMSCNPAIGGIAKGHIVREIDALGGIMGRVIDRTGIQFRLLNRSRGPAVQSPRAQADRGLYRIEMRRMLEETPNLHLRQGVVVELTIENGRVLGVELQDTRRIRAKTVILATGTFLNGTIHTGRRTYSAGRAGEPSSTDLADNLKSLGLSIGRLKTGTPPRLDGRTIEWDKFEIQQADENPVPFSFSTESIEQTQINCFIGYTSEVVHETIRSNIHESPLYSGQIKGIGPRYCPSIEDKVVKFPDKDRHQLFLEPEGHSTHEVYLNGFSTSLPAELQQEIVRKIDGLNNSCIIRPGYAIEYDFIEPRSLTPFLETVSIKGLFLAGQINGTTGYEEAACQGLIAGINAARQAMGIEGFSLRRDEAYIGVLIDDLISHGVDEPYRMFTSRAEHRLSMRYDTSDVRLSPYGRQLGLVGDGEWERFNNRRNRINHLRALIEQTRFTKSSDTYQMLSNKFSADLGDAISITNVFLRFKTDFTFIRALLPTSDYFYDSDFETAFADLMYHHYINSQQNTDKRLYQHDCITIPSDFSFRSVSGLSHEMVERYERHRPSSFGQARRLPGITPAASAALLVNLKAASSRIL